ncbi:hypothetical protein D3C78_948860 [compost metagenome]
MCGEEPARGDLVQLLRLAGMLALQRIAQEAGEQVVVAEPLLLAVHRQQEQVGALQLFEHCPAVVAAGHGVAQRGVELPEDAGLQQELAAFLGLPGKDVLGEVLGQLQVGAGERGNEVGLVVAALERQAGQIEAGDPAFGAFVEGGDIGVAQVQFTLVADELHGLFKGEAQVARLDLQQLAARADAPQADARRRARGHRQRAAARQRIEQLLDEAEHLGVLQHLELVEDGDERSFAAGDQVQQVLALLAAARRRLGIRGQDGAQAVADQQGETLQVVVGGIQVDPQGRLAGGQAALPELLEQGGLAEAGGGADEDQLRRPGILHLLEQSRPRQMGAGGVRRSVLGGDITQRAEVRRLLFAGVRSIRADGGAAGRRCALVPGGWHERWSPLRSFVRLE